MKTTTRQMRPKNGRKPTPAENNLKVQVQILPPQPTCNSNVNALPIG
uniref:Uncharacterized protein n=1 Tax=uncultured alpha proteobacterium HF0130_06E21 TaxID=710808 RepID=E0XT10_9PROT|nr:hypothetical protein [uncultured alpha proteobacterium HF0130_06E21]